MHQDVSRQDFKISPRLTLKNMSSSFLVLVSGYIIATLVFIVEKIVYRVIRVLKKSTAQTKVIDNVIQPIATPLEPSMIQEAATEEAKQIS